MRQYVQINEQGKIIDAEQVRKWMVRENLPLTPGSVEYIIRRVTDSKTPVTDSGISRVFTYLERTAEQPVPKIIRRTDAVLSAAYSLLGDGQGGEWYENTEYTRAVCEMVAELLPIPEDMVDLGGDDKIPFILGMIYGGHTTREGLPDRGV